MRAKEIGPAARVLMLVLGLAAQTASAIVSHGAAFLIPALQADRGLSLGEAGVVVAMPTVGVMLTLIAWGALADAVGERIVLAIGLLLTAAAGFGAIASTSLLGTGAFLLLAGAGAASANAASGRVVIGHFPAHRRGLVMGIRQMAQPLGVGLASLTMPTLAEHHGIAAALWVPAIAAGVVGIGCGLLIVDPPRPPRSQAPAAQVTNPYRGSGVLWRIHSVSVLLVVPQFVVWTYALVWLISERQLSAAAAGVVVTVSQLLGAVGRIAVGYLSDRVGSRMRPLRWVAIAAVVVMALLAVTDAVGSPVSVVFLVIATVITVADNGLAFTSVAEIGGPYWAGRALGAQNTAQFLGASLVPPLVGVLITGLGYPAAFAITALFPALAVPLVPRKDVSRS